MHLDIKKIDSVLTPDQHDIMLRAVRSEMFSWNLISDIANNGNQSDDLTQYAFRHRVWFLNQPVSEWASLFADLLDRCVVSTGGELVYIPKVFVNLNMNYGRQNPNLAHCDGFMDMETESLRRYTGIYYINDSDGDTLFFDTDGTTVVASYRPIANTMLVFPSAYLHSRQLPLQHNTRLVLNINVLVQMS